MLLEVLVAFVIALMALGLLYSGGADGLSAARVAARTEEAVARARSRLTAECHGAKLSPGARSGDDGGGFAWKSEVTREESTSVVRGEADDPKPPLRADLWAVRVTITWPGGLRPHRVSLATRCLSIGPAAPS